MFSVTNRWNRHVSVYEENRPDGLADVPAFVTELFDAGELIKASKRSTLVRSQWRGERFVAKCYKTRKMRYLINSFVRGRGSLPAWNNIFLLRRLGIRTLEPVLLLEQRFFRFPGESFLVTREIEGENISVYLQQRGGDLPDEQLAGLRDMFEVFYAARLIHGDLNEDNIMITADGPVLIDLDKLSTARDPADFASRFEAEKVRFLRKLSPWPAAMERVAGIFPPLG